MCRTELSSPEKCLVAPAVKTETENDDDQEEGNSLANMGESSSKLDGLIHILEGPHSLFPHFLETSFPIHLPSDSLLNPFSISLPILSLPRNLSYTFLVVYVLLFRCVLSGILTSIATREKDPTIKTVVFSQFTKFLDIIQIHLQKRGFKFVRLDGTMNLKQRDNALDMFSEEPKFTIMLASLAVCSVGVITP